MNFNREDLLQFDYTDDNEIKLLIPYIMMETAKQVYGTYCDEFEISICGMWNLITKSKRQLAKREREKLVELFTQYFNDGKECSYDEDITLNGLNEQMYSNFIKVEMKDLTNIFINTTLAKLPKQLANILNIQSYFNGNCTYYSLEELVFTLTEEKLNEGEIDWENPNWFKKFTYKELENMTSKFVAYPNIDELLSRRYNTDNLGLDKQYMATINFNSYIEELEQLGIICKVNTDYGQHGSKAVFCRVEHKQVCIVLYSRMSELSKFASENKTKQDDKKQVEPKQTSFVKEHRDSNTRRQKPRSFK